MTKFNHIAPRAFTLLLALAATLLPLKTTNVFAVDDTTDTASPPTCKEGYEYVEAVGKCYKACAEGWERNAETLRCRKIRVEEEEKATADAAEEATTTTGASATSGTTTKTSSSGSSSASTKAETSSTSTKAATSADYADESIPECKSGYEYVEEVGKCYKACTEEQERNPETLRCRKKASTSNSATPASSSSSTSSAGPSTAVDYADEATPTCKAGYEYVESADKCYKACTAEQERNPETNRCRKKTAAGSASSATSSSSSTASDTTTCKEGYEFVESAGKCYKACADDQERNPETNRCKKKQDNTGADYDVDVPVTGGSSAFVATGAVVALVLAGVGFVAFQYRAELKKFFEKRFKKV